MLHWLTELSLFVKDSHISRGFSFLTECTTSHHLFFKGRLKNKNFVMITAFIKRPLFFLFFPWPFIHLSRFLLRPLFRAARKQFHALKFDLGKLDSAAIAVQFCHALRYRGGHFLQIILDPVTESSEFFPGISSSPPPTCGTETWSRRSPTLSRESFAVCRNW